MIRIVLLGLSFTSRMLALASGRNKADTHDVPRPYTPVLASWIAVGNARKVDKRLELTLSGDWTTDEARMLSEGVRIRVV